MGTMAHRLRTISGLSLVFSVACGAAQPAPEAAPPAPVASASALPPAPIQSSVTPVASAAPPAPAPVAPPPPAPVFRIAEGISTPESVLYDEPNDRYLVSNINGKPDGADNNGYITEISPDGKVTKDKFIAGGVGKVKLDAPKGSGITGGVFYVTDITVVRKFDAKTGAPKGDIPIPGSTFLNDLAVAPDGRVFVSDSGVKVGEKGFEATGTDAVYVIEKGKVKPIAKGKELGQPNGIMVWEKSLLCNTMASNELYRLDEKGAKVDVTTLPEGGLDGLVSTGDSLLVSSWKGAAIYRGKLGQKFEAVLTGFKGGPADIGYDSKRKRVLVPRFMDNAVEVYDLK